MTFASPNITRPYELLTYVNNTTDGTFGTIVILGDGLQPFASLTLI